ncbi:MFS transporter [Leisingera sp. ANG-Vp]|uniref:MFS transporter n=1 Tax=Leisingera sp. ANG-Vp TaxID=1577896 RepID=UPI00057C3B0D|nr:MFS transporter [Leisingera sp. ANG-Vp]KIC21611.1 MFS transporter [Leisingera sp. ANG-Vp]
MPAAKSPPHFFTLIVLTAYATLSLNMFLPSLPGIAADLDADYATVSLAVSGYLGITAVIQLIAGSVSDRIGRRPVLLAATALFAAASLVCALAQDVWTFLAFRMLQGGIISGYALSLAIVRDTSSEQRAAGLIGYISLGMAVAPMLGPMLGGLLDSVFGWRASFHFYAVSGLLLFALCWADLGETRPARAGEAPLPAGGAAALLRAPLFWAYSLCGAFSTGAFYIFLTGAPLAAAAQFAMPSSALGICIGSITAGFMAGSLISAKLAPHCTPAALMLAGRLVACAGLAAGLALTLAGPASPVLFFGCTVFAGLGNGITMPACNAAAMSVEPRLAGSAAGISGALTVAAGAVLTALTGWSLPAANPAPALLLLMLLASAAGLAAVLAAVRLRRGGAGGREAGVQ